MAIISRKTKGIIDLSENEEKCEPVWNKIEKEIKDEKYEDEEE